MLSKRGTKKRSFFHVEWHSFWVLVKMLLANSLSFDWKGNKKKAILKIALSVLGFAVVAAVSYVFFYFCMMFNIFSLLAFVPMAVPSIIVTILIIVSFIGSLGRVTEDLYFANDNKVLLTLPTDGNTLFLSRLFVCFVNTYLKALLLEIPFLVGYFLVSKYPVYMYFVVFVVWALIDMTMLLLASLLSVPAYYIKKYLRTHGAMNAAVISFFILLLLAFCAFVIVMIPERVDVFSNWGPYFTKIQSAMTYYKTSMPFFYQTSMLYLGDFSGFNFCYFSRSAISGLWTLLALIVLIPSLFIATLAFANPLYLKLASGTGELQGKAKKKEKTLEEKRSLSPLFSQLHKEALLFFKDSSFSSSYLGIFLALPLLLSLVNKLFSAMDLNAQGEKMVQVVSLLIMLLIALNANSTIAKIYSHEGGAFKLSRTYPLKDSWAVGSKLVIPSFFGVLSIVATVICMALIRPSMAEGTIYMGIGAALLYVGHLLFSAGVDFTNPRSPFGDVSFFSSNENRSVIFAFATAILASVLYYLYLQDNIFWLATVYSTAGFKVLLVSVIYLALNILLYVRRIKYIYKTGESL